MCFFVISTFFLVFCILSIVVDSDNWIVTITKCSLNQSPAYPGRITFLKELQQVLSSHRKCVLLSVKAWIQWPRPGHDPVVCKPNVIKSNALAEESNLSWLTEATEAFLLHFIFWLLYVLKRKALIRFGTPSAFCNGFCLHLIPLR